MKDYLVAIVGVVLALVVVGVVMIALNVAGTWGGRIANDPYYQDGFRGEVSGLVTEYCTAPRDSDKQGARQQLNSKLAGDPDRVQRLPNDLRRKAYAVSDNNPQEACS
jgi:hypothetical protein